MEDLEMVVIKPSSQLCVCLCEMERVLIKAYIASLILRTGHLYHSTSGSHKAVKGSSPDRHRNVAIQFTRPNHFSLSILLNHITRRAEYSIAIRHWLVHLYYDKYVARTQSDQITTNFFSWRLENDPRCFQLYRLSGNIAGNDVLRWRNLLPQTIW